MRITTFFTAILILIAIASSCKVAGEWRDCLTRCAAEPEVGPCDAAFPKYYFDEDEGKCIEFIWGGCDGVVPFDSLEECEQCDCN